MRLEKIKEEDLLFLSDIFQEVFQQEPWKEPWNQTSSYQHLQMLYHSAGFIGYKVYDDELIGFVMGCLDVCYDGMLFLIKELCVCSSFQHLGYGQKILNLLEESLKKQHVEGILLWTHHGLKTFYEKAGYQMDQDLIIMKKEI